MLLWGVLQTSKSLCDLWAWKRNASDQLDDALLCFLQRCAARCKVWPVWSSWCAWFWFQPLHKVRHFVCFYKKSCFLWKLSSNSTWLLVGSWLFCIHHLPILVSFLVYMVEIVCRFEQRTFYIGSLTVKLIWYAKRCYNEFGPQWTRIGCSSFKFNHYLRACNRSGKNFLISYARQPMENPLPTPGKKVPLSRKMVLIHHLFSRNQSLATRSVFMVVCYAMEKALSHSKYVICATFMWSFDRPPHRPSGGHPDTQHFPNGWWNVIFQQKMLFSDPVNQTCLSELKG